MNGVREDESDAKTEVAFLLEDEELSIRDDRRLITENNRFRRH